VYCLGDERKTCSSGHGNIPFTLFGIFVLASEELKKHGNDFWKCDLGEVLWSFDISVKETLRS
jgi:hypothetical protein